MNTIAKVDAFEQIIRHQSVVELMPFLLTLPKTDVVAVRKKTHSLHRELTEHRQLGLVTWGRTGTYAQLQMLFLAAFRTYSSKEALAAPFANELSLLNPTLFSNNEKTSLPHQQLLGLVKQLLAHHNPAWLAAWLGDNNRNGFSAPIDFEILVDFERLGFITPSPRLVALSALGTLATYGTQATMLRQLNAYEHAQVALVDTQQQGLAEMQQRFPWVAPNKPAPAFANLIYERVSRNPALYERAIPFFFEFDINQDAASAHYQEHKVWQRVTWRDIILHLLATQHLNRADILTRCLLALRRDFRRPLLTWFKDLFLSLEPTRAERLARQTELTELLAHPLPLVVNFAIEQLKDVWPEPGFALAPLLQYADNLLLRPDLKTGLKTLLAGLARLPRQQPAHAPAVASLLAAALAHPDAGVQERAAKGLADLLGARKPLLAPAETAATLATLAGQAELLGPAARTVLATWLVATEPAPAVAAAYAPLARFVPELSPATAIVPVADWHELLFLTGQVVRHDDPLALERWLDGLLRLHGQLPAGYAEQLGPYLVQVLPFLKGKSGAQAQAILGTNGLRGHSGLAQALLLSWAQGFTALRVPRVLVQEDSDASDPLVAVEKQRLAAAEQHLHRQTGLPLLSTPTHAPYWVAPSVLVQKLLAYQTAQREPDTADLAIALARTAHAHAADAQAALARLPQLHHDELRALLHWYLSPTALAPPLPEISKKPLLKQWAARLHQLLPGSPAAPEPLAEALPWLWVVAARTRFPAHVFSELPGPGATDYPGVAQPWVPSWEFEVKVNTYVETWKPGRPEVTHRATNLVFAASQPKPGLPSPLLLYSQHVHFRNMAHASWSLGADYPFIAALVPANPAALHWHVVRTAGWADKLESAERDVITQALQHLLAAGPPFAEATTLVLAVGLLHHTPANRALAQEVLLRAVASQRLVPAALGQALGQLLGADYAPVARLADGLPQLRAVSPELDDALAQTLDTLLPGLPSNPPCNLRKLLEAYADLGARTGRPVPPAVRSRLAEWGQTAALKKLTASLV
ncbi:DUF6493 family protein [Hymenobacter cheonanensis]|uniref:DUF6493 family protein n=1 Tax=Hymenobacter sp. CA2-7 TaxID=3063993 RepID=UPI0027137220|nr:DUF6493 family protein [Hymenobacter sp. CA2-7]MDO7886271.1 DUF6493 family protein [Hymenobacter sp. CA2-7]